MNVMAVVLVHFGDPEITSGCLRNLRDVESLPHRVVVVDHGPPPGLGGILEGLHPRLTVLTNLGNPGFGAGCNLGASRAFEEGAGGVWFLNNDARLESPMLAAFWEQSRRHPEVALWGTHQLENARRLGADQQPPWFAEGIEPAQVSDLQGGRTLAADESLSGASLFVTRESWGRLGPWPEEQFLYYEDAAWCRRAHLAGLPLVLLDSAVIHTRGSTTGRRSRFTTFYGTRNRLMLLKDSRPKGRRGLLLWEATYLLQRRLFRGQWSLLGPTWNGFLAAWKGQSGRNPRY
jgi:GT2 family glycosyltransferase